MSVELPKDAEGREIPLDTNVLYDQDGNPREVARFAYTLLRDCDKWDVIFVNGYDRYTSEMLLEPPDSWEKLEEDLGRGKDICDYYEDCPAEMDGKSCSECKKAALKNIASRIRKLRGEGK